MDAETTAMLRTSLQSLLKEATDRPLADRLAELGWAEVVADDRATALGLLFDVKGETNADGDALAPCLRGLATDAVTATGRWLVAAELVGLARHVVLNAAQYTNERVQYGKKIGTFQALQHRIASAYSLVVGASHLVEQAGLDGDPFTAMVAKAMAGRAAEFACTQAQQCYGAIGFTWEHEFHRYLKRAYELDRLFGDWRTLEFEIGMTLQSTGVVPRIGSL